MDELIDANNARRRFAASPIAHLATVTAERAPHVVPCCFAVLDDTIVTAIDGKVKSTLALKRLANIAEHPAVSMVVDHYEDDWSQLWWVRADGPAEVITEGAAYETALDQLAAKYRQYRDLRPRGAVIVIRPTTWRSWTAE